MKLNLKTNVVLSLKEPYQHVIIILIIYGNSFINFKNYYRLSVIKYCLTKS